MILRQNKQQKLNNKIARWNWRRLKNTWISNNNLRKVKIFVRRVSLIIQTMMRKRTIRKSGKSYFISKKENHNAKKICLLYYFLREIININWPSFFWFVLRIPKKKKIISKEPIKEHGFKRKNKTESNYHKKHSNQRESSEE